MGLKLGEYGGKNSILIPIATVVNYSCEILEKILATEAVCQL